MNWRFFYTSWKNNKPLVFLLVAAIALFGLGLQKETIVKTQVLPAKVVAISPTVKPSNTPTVTQAKTVTVDDLEPTDAPSGPTLTPATIIIQVTRTQAQQVSNQSPVVHVSVSGGGSFDVQVGNSANQCDVLTTAQNAGKIHDLVMRYDDNLGTYGVYKINGIGKDNQIWWTYSVNGQDPPKGCSYIKANNGDNVVWTYRGS